MKLIIPLLFLGLIVPASAVVAYEVISIQQQEFTTSSEVIIENSTSEGTSTTEIYQQQWQRSKKPSHETTTEIKSVKITAQQEGKGTPKPNNKLRLEYVGEPTESRPTATPSTKPISNCEEIKDRVTTHVTTFQNSYQQRENKFKRIHQTVSELITRLQNNGTDVSQLQTALSAVQTERAQLLNAADIYMLKAEEISELSCDVASGERRSRFAELRTARSNYEQELRDVRTAINTQLKPALQAVSNNLGAN